MNKDEKELSENLKDYIGNYPNTYAYTKCMAEKNLMQTREHVNLVIYRPSIIACAWRQPFRGWTDTLSAAGGLSLLYGLGLTKYINGDGSGYFDIIPVDFVTNGMLIATAKGGSSKDYFEVYNAGTSYGNKCTSKNYRDVIHNAYKNKRLN